MVAFSIQIDSTSLNKIHKDVEEENEGEALSNFRTQLESIISARAVLKHYGCRNDKHSNSIQKLRSTISLAKYRTLSQTAIADHFNKKLRTHY